MILRNCVLTFIGGSHLRINHLSLANRHACRQALGLASKGLFGSFVANSHPVCGLTVAALLRNHVVEYRRRDTVIVGFRYDRLGEMRPDASATSPAALPLAWVSMNVRRTVTLASGSLFSLVRGDGQIVEIRCYRIGIGCGQWAVWTAYGWLVTAQERTRAKDEHWKCHAFNVTG